MGRIIATIACAIVILAATYELVAVWTSLPTISRTLQVGSRNWGTALAALVIAFGGWLLYHLRWAKRSELRKRRRDARSGPGP